jgi:hypothetical protein
MSRSVSHHDRGAPAAKAEAIREVVDRASLRGGMIGAAVAALLGVLVALTTSEHVVPTVLSLVMYGLVVGGFVSLLRALAGHRRSGPG